MDQPSEPVLSQGEESDQTKSSQEPSQEPEVPVSPPPGNSATPIASSSYENSPEERDGMEELRDVAQKLEDDQLARHKREDDRRDRLRREDDARVDRRDRLRREDDERDERRDNKRKRRNEERDSEDRGN